MHLESDKNDLTVAHLTAFSCVLGQNQYIFYNPTLVRLLTFRALYANKGWCVKFPVLFPGAVLLFPAHTSVQLLFLRAGAC